MMKLDDRDLKMLSVLQADGRISKNALAERVNLSPSACWERLRRLEESGVIEGYSARISPKAVGQKIEIIMQAELGSHRAADFRRFEAAVAAIPEITDCWSVGGGVDYFLKFSCADIDAYQRLVDQMLDTDIGLKRYFTFIVTKAVKNGEIGGLASMGRAP